MTIHSIIKIRSFAFILAGLVSFGSQPMAQSAGEALSLMPAQTTIEIDTEIEYGAETHPPLRLTPDKSEIVLLDNEIERVIIGNDNHVNIFLDTARRMIVVPRLAGATHFTLMGENGKIIMRRHVIVASPKQDYIRIRQSCAMATEDCAPTRMYYCPGMCHEITLQDGTEQTTTGLAPAPMTSSMPPTGFDDEN